VKTVEELLEGAEVVWSAVFAGVVPDLEKQDDSLWYEGLGFLFTVSYKGFEVDVYADGEVRVIHEPTETILRTPSDFYRLSMNCDEDLRLANGENALNWDNNNWLDMYCRGEHLDWVCDSISEALQNASSYVREQYENEKMLLLDFA
jgi:hypothetical protein